MSPTPGAAPPSDAELLASVAPGADPELDALLVQVADRGLDALGAATALREAGVDAARAAAALTQAELRGAGHAKFGDRAERMLFTRAGLEQATRWQVAALHARTFAEAGTTHVTDVGCGLGADSHAIAAAGATVTALEVDPATAAAARHNLSEVGARVLHAEADSSLQPPTGVAPEQWGLWFDPARRTGVSDVHGRSHRVSGPAALQPSFDLVQELAGRAALTGCKVGPGWRHRDVPEGAHAQWVSHDGDLVEAVLWMRPALGRTAAGAPEGDGPDPVTAASRPRPGLRSATRLAADGTVLAHVDSSTLVTDPTGGPTHRILTSTDEPAAYLWEPDPALSQAGLAGVLAQEAQGSAELGPGVGWLTGPDPGDPTWVRSHRVVDVLSPRPKVLNAWARERDVGELVLRKHGSSLDPARLRRQLRTGGSERAVLLLTRLGDRQVAIELGP
ncbi:methyltransferase domain-containing protein [Kytococcus sedentarius]|uniref:class I SAM-dependent methyltransferase n=1 Tax=Kytococcus sedentarius TaxID=1276 RepID=UPI0035BC7BAE